VQIPQRGFLEGKDRSLVLPPQQRLLTVNVEADAAVVLFGQVESIGWQVRRIRDVPPLFLTCLQLLFFVAVELALVSEPSADSVVWFPAQALQKIANTARMTRFFKAIFPWFGGKKTPCDSRRSPRASAILCKKKGSGNWVFPQTLQRNDVSRDAKYSPTTCF
jgi:hypothetical protein